MKQTNAHMHMHVEQGMYKYVQKAGGEIAGESEGLFLKEWVLKLRLESVLCGCSAEREGKGAPGDSLEGREGSRADGGQLVWCVEFEKNQGHGSVHC